MTDEITITGTGVQPQIGTIGATQTQPNFGSVNVKNGAAAGRTLAVKTSGSGSTASGPVVITIAASDSGVGLSGAPELTLINGASSVPLTGTLTSGTVLSGTFTYNWEVPAGADGTWTAQVIASDTLSTPTRVTNANAFTLAVNTSEASGVVELESFLGTSRTVTFKTGIGATNQWDYNLNFVSGLLLNAGAFQDRAGFAAKIKNPQDPLTTYLRYGDVTDVQSLAFKLVNQRGGVATHIYGLLYGSLSNLYVFTGRFASPTRAIDAYIVSRLQNATILAIAAYRADPTNQAAAAAVTSAILNDFNTIVLGVNIWEPVRFDGILATPPSGSDTVAINRALLRAAYASYTPGKLHAQTAQRLSQYAGGADATLEALLLADFDWITLDPVMWPVHIIVGYDVGLYSQATFLGVTLTQPTLDLITSGPTGDVLTLLNQRLLEDAFAGMYQRAPVTPVSVQAAINFDALDAGKVQHFETNVVADLNVMIGRGTSIYDTDRFAPWNGAIDPAGELYQLLHKASLTPAEQIRENRLLLELAYGPSTGSGELSAGVLAAYRLVQVPAGASLVNAKTAWNLGVNLPFAATGVNFVNDGVLGYTAADKYLRGGDVTGDNAVSLPDYNILRQNYGGTSGGPADINGDGKVNIYDYQLMKLNFGKFGQSLP